MRFVYLSIVAWVVLTVFSTVFAISADKREVRVLGKTIWLAIILFVPIVGSLLYLTIGRPVADAPNQPVAPDDDPEFLRKLAERLKNDDKNE